MAEIKASQESYPGAAAAVADGQVPAAGSRDDRRAVWVVPETELPVELEFSWPQPITVSTVVYYGRTAWGLECFKDYAIYIDGAVTPVIEGAFRNAHGPQLIQLREPTRLSRLRMVFSSHHGGKGPGAAEIQIFESTPDVGDLLCRFTDLSLDYRYAYYPSHHLVRIHVPKPPEDASIWHLELRSNPDKTLLAETSGKLPMAPVGEAMPVPDLPEGDYILTLTLAGDGQAVIEERHLRRDRPEWEGDRLGLEEVVIPPFEPLGVDSSDNSVNCVLRSHSHGEAGLWRQVSSQGHDLLADPVRLEVVSGETVYIARGELVRITEATPTRVRGEAEWTAGPVSGTTQFDYDYDGLKTITLKLLPTVETIDRLQLVIPMRAGETWLMHPVTTGLRQHYAGRIPDGEGRVWDTSAVPNRLAGIFVPYLYLGGPERGICFAADNDRDWITDPEIPMMVIEREGDTVNLRLNIIARPSQLVRERTLTFALQATPAKPMPEMPYHWRRWWATGTDRDIDTVQINFWGGNQYWGGRHFATSVYPAFEDYSYWDHLADLREVGRWDSGFLDQWMQRFENLPAKDRQSLFNHFRWGMQSAAGAPLNSGPTGTFHFVIPYINPRGAHIETREFITTYIDEWLQGDIVDPRWNAKSTFHRPRRVHSSFPGSATWYQVEPVPSRIDMLLHYHRKMLETFADGIYWDNFFLQPSFVPGEAGGPGYVDDDGRPRPGVNLMGLRSLVKRTATMMHTMGMQPLTYIHMTNVNIVPMLSFGTINLDWEWRDQGHFVGMDLQDRLHADRDTAMILAHNLGLQAGNIPVAITGNILRAGSGATREWLSRTGMAVCFPHEIRMHGGDRTVSFIQNEMARFGYGMEDCHVYRYWEEGFPLEMEGANMHALVLAREGRVMLAIGNYGPMRAGNPEFIDTFSDGPSLEAYDAGQLGLAEPVVPEPKRPKHPDPMVSETYTVRLILDLEALGLSGKAHAYDVELRAGREKARNLVAKKPPPLAVNLDTNPDGQDTLGLDFDLEIKDPSRLRRLAPGVFELTIPHHDFALIEVK